MVWSFILIQMDAESNILETVIDNPIGWNGLSSPLVRDEWHGCGVQLSTGNLQFINDGYWIIKEEYILRGVDGNIGIRIDWRCDECDGFKVYFQGKLDFRRYKEFCGSDCYVTLGIEDNSLLSLLKDRQDTDVDLTGNLAYDAATTLTDYTALGQDISIPSKALHLKAEANFKSDPTIENDDSYDITEDIDYKSNNNVIPGFIVPKFNNVIFSEIEDFTPSFAFDYMTFLDGTLDTELDGFEIIKLKPSNIQTINNTINISFRLKGQFYTKTNTNSSPFGRDIHVKLRVLMRYGVNKVDAFPIKDIGYYSDTVPFLGTRENTMTFDYSNAVTLQLTNAESIWLVILMETFESGITLFTSPFRNLRISLTEDSFFKADSISTTTPTPAKTFLIHEAASRVVESISNNQLKFKSAYYGRTDSQPYAFLTDGCNSLLGLTNGILLRRALLTDGTQPKVFTSFKKIKDSCDALDCVGVGIEYDDALQPVVAMEPITHFYSPDIIFTADGVNELTRSIKTDRIWNTFKFGFDKFETENTNGLDAIHTQRQYRTPLIHTDQTLEKLCLYIFDGYAIEVTRRLFGTTADWRYDQNIFGLCLKRGAPYDVEQGNIVNGANLFDPPTIINYRASPIRNALHWFKWIMQGVTHLVVGDINEASQMLFNSGVGNYVAEGELTSNACNLENDVIAENDAVSLSDFFDPVAGTPFIMPETVEFTYPLGLNEFLFIKDNMYGLIQYRHSEMEQWSYGWIEKIDPSHEEGDAKFTLTTALIKGTVSTVVRPTCPGETAVITSLISDGGTGAIITATVYAGTVNDIYASIDNVSFTLILSGKSSAQLSAGVTIADISSYKYFRIHSYNVAANCDYGISIVARYYCPPMAIIDYTDNGNGTIKILVDNINAGVTLTVYGATTATGIYTQIGSTVTSIDGVTEIDVDATVYSFFKVGAVDDTCDFGFSNIINFVYDVCSAGFAPTIDTIVESGTSIIITGNAVATGTVQIFGSTALTGTYTPVGDSYIGSDLVSGITLTPAQYGVNSFFKVYSYDDNCIYGYSSGFGTGVPTEDINPVFFVATDEIKEILWTAARIAKYGLNPVFQVWIYNENTGLPEITSVSLDADLPYPNTTKFTYHNAGAAGYIVIK